MVMNGRHEIAGLRVRKCSVPGSLCASLQANRATRRIVLIDTYMIVIITQLPPESILQPRFWASPISHVCCDGVKYTSISKSFGGAAQAFALLFRAFFTSSAFSGFSCFNFALLNLNFSGSTFLASAQTT
ncbi:hypothetical protein G7K_4167-t1 [Saitoella complicata NRRL Y-17804]|uniref:Uncharacterized protein n=1 Tax=Saitoella complicata (strain BCRC 22490 / CBS 7301 / JCM 7358 / NBRC 10748 / NRRL Y-17804) TaxID=698492 RepID=A0A0E9NJI0_SAICN|nr:hypothetical protein G7K_4167-t1 [Saitoella complicata NRRL Y-17804]